MKHSLWGCYCTTASLLTLCPISCIWYLTLEYLYSIPFKRIQLHTVFNLQFNKMVRKQVENIEEIRSLSESLYKTRSFVYETVLRLRTQSYRHMVRQRCSPTFGSKRKSNASKVWAKFRNDGRCKIRDTAKAVGIALSRAIFFVSTVYFCQMDIHVHVYIDK